MLQLRDIPMLYLIQGGQSAPAPVFRAVPRPPPPRMDDGGVLLPVLASLAAVGCFVLTIL